MFTKIKYTKGKNIGEIRKQKAKQNKIHVQRKSRTSKARYQHVQQNGS